MPLFKKDYKFLVAWENFKFNVLVENKYYWCSSKTSLIKLSFFLLFARIIVL